MDLERFRQVLRRCRRSLVGSQEQLSERTKTDGATPINLNTISAIERGDTDDPGIVTIARLVEAMPGLTLSEFFRQVEAEAVPNESTAAPLSETVPVPRKTYDQLLEWFVLSVQENQREPGANRRHAANARHVRVGGADSAARKRHQDQHPPGQTRGKAGKPATKQRKR